MESMESNNETQPPFRRTEPLPPARLRRRSPPDREPARQRSPQPAPPSRKPTPRGEEREFG